MRKQTTLALSGMLACLMFAGIASAQTGPIDGGKQPSNGGGDTTQLTDQNFPQMLKQLGYKVETRKNNKGLDFWKITAQENGWGFVVEVVPQRTNGKIIGFWMISDLGAAINNPNAVSPAALLKLMEKSHQMAPFFFSYNVGSKHIAMNYEYPSGKITQSNMKTQFSNFFKKVRDTYKLWDTKVVMGGPAPPNNGNPQPVPNPGVVKLAGTSWTGTESLQNFGKLTFQFAAGGKATMIDTAGVSNGTWTQNGNQVNIQFFNGKVTYSGVLNGNAISGNASNTAGAKWTFKVSKSS